MKKKMLTLLLSLILLLTACGSKPSETTPPTAPTYPQAAEVSGDRIRIGQYRAEIPDTFQVYETDENNIVLTSTELHCIIGLFAYDVASLPEDEIELWMDQRLPPADDAGEVDTAFSNMELRGHFWVELDDDLQPTAKIQATFTDSWYVYQINTILMPGSEETDAMSESIAFLMSFVADDVPARFDFIQ